MVSISASLNLDILAMKFDSRLTFEDHVCGIVSRVSLTINILRLVKRVFVLFCTALFLQCICSANPSALFSCVWVCCRMSSSASQAPGVFGGQAFALIRFTCHCVIGVMLLHCIFCTRLIRT